jgi:hypothetical protein
VVNFCGRRLNGISDLARKLLRTFAVVMCLVALTPFPAVSQPLPNPAKGSLAQTDAPVRIDKANARFTPAGGEIVERVVKQRWLR